MLQAWRWFGPDDPVTLPHVRQAGATAVVTALHHLNHGTVWPVEEVAKRRAEIERHGLVWSVVESIAVHESIKTRSKGFRDYITANKQSLRAAASAGVKVFCFNFMAITDWTRTDLAYPMGNGGTALRFDVVDFCAYDVFILRRPNAEADYAVDRLRSARARLNEMSEERKATLERNLIDWVPAREFVYSRESFREILKTYDGLTTDDLRTNLIDYLKEIVQVAEECNVRLAIHPDDPPFPLFGLPRVVSTAEDIRKLFAAVPAAANGLTFCTGSLGARPDNDLVAMAREFGSRVYFAHLRNTTREPGGSFHEAEHLAGDTDMVAVIEALLAEEMRRRDSGQIDHDIPMRPDHGHALMDDARTAVNPGYSAIGRLKGLAELRGVLAAFAHRS